MDQQYPRAAPDKDRAGRQADAACCLAPPLPAPLPVAPAPHTWYDLARRPRMAPWHASSWTRCTQERSPCTRHADRVSQPWPVCKADAAAFSAPHHVSNLYSGLDHAPAREQVSLLHVRVTPEWLRARSICQQPPASPEEKPRIDCQLATQAQCHPRERRSTSTPRRSTR